jgi:iron complex outermembrane receptor protein
MIANHHDRPADAHDVRIGEAPALPGALNRRAALRLVGMTTALMLSTSLGLAQSRLPDLSLEELMKLDAGQVFGASERLQPVTEAPSSVSFITRDEIARLGYRTLADILRGVRGMHVTDDRNFSFIGARGFAQPGDYNSRILLLVNGHRVNDNVYGQAEIGTEFGLDPAMFERVEIIRGPASSIYGDSAFFAVVNVITRSGGSIAGGSLVTEVGTLGSTMLRASAGHEFKRGASLALSGTLQHSDGVEKLYYPAFDSPETNNGIAENLDSEGARQFYARLDFSGLTVTGAYGTRKRTVPTASFGTLFNEQESPERTTDRHTLLDAEYGRMLGATRVTFRGSFDQFSYDGFYPFAGIGPDDPKDIGHNSVLGTRWSAGSRITRALPGRQVMTAGVEFIDNVRQNQESHYEPDLVVLDLRRSSTQHAIYAQDEIKLSSWMILNAGLRYDSYDDFQRFTPRAALIFTPSSTQSLKYLYGNAFRAPNAWELNTFNFGTEVESLRPESIDTHEFVWERYTGDWLRTSVSTYWYKADRLITLVPGGSGFLGLTYQNLGQVRAKGLELEAQMRLKWRAQALMSYGLQRAVNQETRTDLANSPRHMVKGRLSVPLPNNLTTVSVEGLFMSSRDTLAHSTVDPVATFDVTAHHKIGRSWELFAGVRNLFDAQYADPASSQHLQDSIPQNGRTARIGLKLNLWGK